MNRHETVTELKAKGAWDDFYISAKGLAEIINSLPAENLSGIEIGVDMAYSTVYMLDHCPKIKMLYGVDPWTAYNDWNSVHDIEEVTKAKNTAFANLRDYQNITIIEKTGNDAVGLFEDGTMDFIFIDGDHSYQGARSDMENYWPKMKKGAIFAGHDIGLPDVHKALVDFRTKHDIRTQAYSGLNQIWWWIKE